MSNRMKVVDILLSEIFVNYQKIILTHELGFFREFRRKLGAAHPTGAIFASRERPPIKSSPKAKRAKFRKAKNTYTVTTSTKPPCVCARRAKTPRNDSSARTR